MARTEQITILPGILSGAMALLAGFVVFFMPIYFKETLEFSGVEIGILFAGYGFTSLIVVIPSGFGSDAVTPKRLVLAALLLAVAAAAILVTAKSFALVLAAVLGVGIASHVVKVAVESFLYKTHESSRTGHTFGLYQAVRMAGYSLAVAGGGYVVDYFDFPTAVIYIAIAILVLGLFAFFLPSVPVRWSGVTPYIRDISKSDVVLFVLWLFLFATHWGAETTSYALFLKENLDLAPVEIGWYMTGEFIFFVIANYAAGRLYDQGLSLAPMLRFGLVLAGIGHIGMVWPSVLPSLMMRVVHGLGDGCANMVMYIGVARLFLRERVGGNLGIVTFVTMAGQFVGAIVFGPLGEKQGYGWPFIISGGILALLAFFPFGGSRAAKV